MTDDFVFSDDDDSQPIVTDFWNVLIVDDAPEIHQVTKLALSHFQLNNKGLKFISAHSAAEAKSIMHEMDHCNIAVILLDVVMESDKAGLELANYVRKELNNKLTRIILRTGHPHDVPERKVVVEYDINDYKAKSDLTVERLYISLVTSLRAYDELIKSREREIVLSHAKTQLEQAISVKNTSLLDVTVLVGTKYKITNDMEVRESFLVAFHMLQFLRFALYKKMCQAAAENSIWKCCRILCNFRMFS